MIVLCPAVWLAAFLVGSRVGLVPAIGVAAALLTVLSVAVDGRKLVELFRPRPRDLLVGLVLAGALVGLVLAGFHLLAPVLARSTAELYAHFPRATSPAVIALIVIAEEIVWRGAVQSWARNPFAAAGLYAVAHLTSGAWLLCALAAVLGLFWSLLRARTGSLVPSLLTHLAFDIVFLYVRPLG